MTNAYLYIRFSTKDQEGGDSYDRQDRGGRGLIESKGWTLVETVEDLGKSAWKGKHLNGGELGKFSERVRAGDIAAGSWLVAEKTDRLSRQGWEELMATGTEAARKVQQDIEELKADRARNQQRTDSQEASIIKNADLDNADAMIQKTQQLSGLLTQLWDDPTAAMKSFFSSFLSSLLQSIAQATILKNTMAQAGAGGGFGGILKTAIGAAFGGARAGGGSVSGSSFYLVGEKGPELFAPGRSGTIIPNHALGGSNPGQIQARTSQRPEPQSGRLPPRLQRLPRHGFAGGIVASHV